MRSTVADASQYAAESTRGRAILYSILLPRHRHCGCIPQPLRWRMLDPRTGEAQAVDLGYVVRNPLDWANGCGPARLVANRKSPALLAAIRFSWLRANPLGRGVLLPP